VAIVCHSLAALRHVKTPDGKPLVEGKEVTGFTNGEEEAVGLTKVVPFLVEDEMLRLGATFSKKANWTPRVVNDGLRITGQNPHSSGPSANAPLAALKGKPIARASGSRLVQHALCRPEIGGFEPFREPGIGFGELFEGILHTLPNPMPRQRHPARNLRDNAPCCSASSTDATRSASAASRLPPTASSSPRRRSSSGMSKAPRSCPTCAMVSCST
jgi:hypothetical protein